MELRVYINSPNEIFLYKQRSQKACYFNFLLLATLSWGKPKNENYGQPKSNAKLKKNKDLK